MSESLKIGDRVNWDKGLDPEQQKQLVEDYGPGPFVVYKEAMHGDKQLVVLACKTHNELLVLDDRLQILYEAGTPEAEAITPGIGALLLKKL